MKLVIHFCNEKWVQGPLINKFPYRYPKSWLHLRFQLLIFLRLRRLHLRLRSTGLACKTFENTILTFLSYQCLVAYYYEHLYRYINPYVS
jgi:hypothetical protein